MLAPGALETLVPPRYRESLWVLSDQMKQTGLLVDRVSVVLPQDFLISVPELSSKQWASWLCNELEHEALEMDNSTRLG